MFWTCFRIVSGLLAYLFIELSVRITETKLKQKRNKNLFHFSRPPTKLLLFQFCFTYVDSFIL